MYSPENKAWVLKLDEEDKTSKLYRFNQAMIDVNIHADMLL